MTTQRFGQSRSPELAEVLLALKANIFDGLSVAMPATVVSYTAATQVAKVKPLLKRAVIGEDGTTIQEELPEIPQVPVMFPRGGGYFLTFPLVPGDMVMLVFMDKSIDSFMLSAGNVAMDQVDLRMHHLTDAVAIPGFYPATKVIAGASVTDAVLGKELGGPTISLTTTQVDINGNFTVDL